MNDLILNTSGKVRVMAAGFFERKGEIYGFNPDDYVVVNGYRMRKDNVNNTEIIKFLARQ